MEPPAHFPVLCKKALRIALSLHKKQPQADLVRCRSAQTSSLLSKAYSSQASSVEVSSLFMLIM